MKSIEKIGLSDVQGVYSGPEGDLWELVMGQQIHIGGFRSSMDLAEQAGIRPGIVRRGSVLLQRCGHAIPGPLPQCGKDDGVDATQTVVDRGAAARRPKDLPTGLPLYWPTPATADCPTPAPILSGARTPGVTWSTSQN